MLHSDVLDLCLNRDARLGMVMVVFFLQSGHTCRRVYMCVHINTLIFVAAFQ